MAEHEPGRIQKVKKKNRFRHRDAELSLMALPTVLWYILFCYVPMFGIVIAFKRYRLVPGRGFIYSLFVNSEWVGLDNFSFLFLNPQLKHIIFNTIAYDLVFLAIGTVLPVVLAIAYSLMPGRRFAGAAQTAALLPHFLSWVVVSYFVYALLSTDRGFVNSMLTGMGLNPVRWYQEPAYWPFILTAVNIWKSVGYSMLIYISSISGISPSLYESAVIDGAGIRDQIRYITLPQLKPTIVILLILGMGQIFSSDFGLFFHVPRNSSLLLSATQTLDVYVYKALMENANYSFSAAAGLLQNVVGCVLLVMSNMIVRRLDSDSSLY